MVIVRFQLLAPRVCNSLPPHVTSASSVNIFQTRLKTFLFSPSFQQRFSLFVSVHTMPLAILTL